MIKNKYAVILSALVLLIVGCNRKQNTPTPTPAPIEQEVTIVLSEKDSVQLTLEETKEIMVSGENLKQFSVSSSHAEIASVEKKEKSFIIHSLAVGTTMITVTSEKVVKELKVIVSAKKNILIEKIELEDLTKVPIGRNFSLDVTFYPANASNKKLQWTSSDPSVIKAYPDGSFFVFKKPGKEAIITATTTDGTNLSASVKLVATNIVKELRIRAGSEELMAVGSTFILRCDAIGLAEELPPTDATVSWDSNDPSVVTVDQEGRIHCLKEGYADIRATANDGFGATANIRISSFNPVNKIKINNLERGQSITLKRNDVLPLEVTTLLEGAIVEVIKKAKSASQYVDITFSIRNQSNSYMAEVTNAGELKVYKTGTFILRATYQHHLDSGEYVDTEITVNVIN